MSRKQKHPNLPNGFGSIRKLSGNRRNPYAVHPPVKEFTENGNPITPKALCYVSDWYVGFAVLTAYQAGTYKPGLEDDLAAMRALDSTDLSAFTKRILEDYSKLSSHQTSDTMTFSELYEKFYSWKYEGKKKYSKQSKQAASVAYRNCHVLHKKPVDKICYEDLQRIVDACPLKYASLELIVSLLKQMYRYALAQGIVDKNPTELLRINVPDDDEHGVPFTSKDLDVLWNHTDDDIAQVILIMCYSGYRIGELSSIEIDLDKCLFRGGLKTDAGKSRIVPIHSAIFDMVSDRIRKYGVLLPCSTAAFRKSLYPYLEAHGIGRHTPHDCRHTFSMLCERYHVSENDRKRMLGHKFNDVTNSIYGHRSIRDLRAEIEKIPCRKCVENDSKKRA